MIFVALVNLLFFIIGFAMIVIGFGNLYYGGITNIIIGVGLALQASMFLIITGTIDDMKRGESKK
jgi:hypothetical protein